MRDEVREQIADTIFLRVGRGRQLCYEVTDAVLADPNIAIVDREAGLPEISDMHDHCLVSQFPCTRCLFLMGERNYQAKLLTEKGWVKEVTE